MARTTKQKHAGDLLLQALACGATHEAAARQAGVTTRTVARRLADPAFRRELTRIRSDMVARTTGMLTAASLESVKTLLDLQKSGTPAVKLGAARSVIELATRLREIVDIETHLLELEAKLEKLEAGQGSGAMVSGGEDEPWAAE